MKLWIDDEREAPQGWKWVKSSREAIITLRFYAYLDVQVEAISFDHDLGGDDTTRPVVLWMAENDVWPKKTHVHTANVIGREWLIGMIHQYAPHTLSQRW